MGALTSNRKRGIDSSSSNCRTLVSNSSNFGHISKKPKLSINQTLNPPSPGTSFIQRFLKYPNPKKPICREVHAPCRNSRFGYKVNSEYSASEMGQCLSRKHDGTKNCAFDTLSGGKSDQFGQWKETDGFVENRRSALDSKEGIDIEVDTVTEGGSEESSIMEVEARGSEKSHQLGQKSKESDGFVEILDGFDGKDFSDVTTGLDDVNMKEVSVREKLDSLASNPTSDSSFYVPLYKKLLRLLEKTSDRLKRLHFETLYHEKRRETYGVLRPQKKGEQDLITEPFVPLTEEEEHEVSRALSKSNWKRVLVTHANSNIDITGEMLLCLKPRQWLNDEVINVYLELLKEREKRDPKKFLKCHFFNTFFYKKLISGGVGYNYQSVRRWTSQKKLGYSLSECDKIFVPIHKEIHWCLAVINKKDKKFQYLDSLGGRDAQLLKVLARYYVDEVKDKSRKDIDVSTWKQEFVEDLPRQENGFDCGVFMVKYADFYSRNIGLCFNQEHMSYFRMRIAKEILRLKAN